MAEQYGKTKISNRKVFVLLLKGTCYTYEYILTQNYFDIFQLGAEE